MLAIVPNSISFSRILSAPIFCMLLNNGHRFLAFVVFSWGALSDFLDGYLARKNGIESKVGEILDPIADKIFSNSVLWGTYLTSFTADWQILLIAALLSFRDITLIFGFLYASLKKITIEIKPLMISKICTACVFILCSVLLFPFLNPDPLLITVLSSVSLFLILLSLLLYICRFFKENKKYNQFS